ncbi:MAG: type II secretion system F family protein [Candidatus Woesearchaeota archaeon]
MVRKIPLMIVPSNLSKRISKIFTGLSGRITKLTLGLKYDLVEADIELNDVQYVSYSMINGLFFFLLFFGLLFFLNLFVQGKEMNAALTSSLSYGIAIFAIIFFALLRYPRIIAGKKAEMIEKFLLFALKDLRLQITSGVTLFKGMVNISKAGYGMASSEFEKVARAVNTGTPVDKALERMAVETKSGFLRKMTWQLVNTMKAGSSLTGALTTLIRDLTLDQRDKIKRYSNELNLWILVYMMFSVAVPTIGATLLIILSSFAGFGVTKGFFVTFIGICLIIQVVLIGFVKTRRPVVII